MAIPQTSDEWLELLAQLTGGGPERAMGAMPLTGDLSVPGATSAFYDQEMMRAQQYRAMEALIAQLTAQPAEEDIYAGGDRLAGVPKEQRRYMRPTEATFTGQPAGRPSRAAQGEVASRLFAREAGRRPAEKRGRLNIEFPRGRTSRVERKPQAEDDWVQWWNTFFENQRDIGRWG